MACRGFWECFLKLFNFLLTLMGLAIVAYGIYLFVAYEQSSSDHDIAPTSDNMIQLGRPMLMAMSASGSFWDNLPKAWYVVLLSKCVCDFRYLWRVESLLISHCLN